MKKYQTERYKNCSELINCKNHQHEDRVSEIEEKMLTYNELLKEVLKMMRIRETHPTATI